MLIECSFFDNIRDYLISILYFCDGFMEKAYPPFLPHVS